MRKSYVLTIGGPDHPGIIAETTKGKGVSFMENNNEWHHGRITQTLLEQAVGEIGSNTDDNRWSV